MDYYMYLTSLKEGDGDVVVETPGFVEEGRRELE